MAKKKEPVDTTLLEEIGAMVVKSLQEEVFEVDGCPSGTIQKEDGSYRKKEIMAGWEFFPSDCYVGQRNSLIFQFTPVDTQEFKILEVGMSEIDTFFPLMGPKLIEKTPVTSAVAELGEALDGAKEGFKQFGRASERFKDVFDGVMADAVKQKAAEEQKAQSSYAENPEFGAF